MKQHVLSFSGGKDSTAMYLHAMESGRDFLPVFADTGNEHEITLDYVRDLPRRTGGPAIRWVKADFSDDFERKRRFIAEQWPKDGRPDDHVRAGALIVAEIERRDRADASDECGSEDDE